MNNYSFLPEYGNKKSKYDSENVIIPTIVEHSNGVNRSMDVYSKLLDERIVFLSGEVTQQKINVIIAQLIFLDSKNKKPIKLYIDSPGGSVFSGLALHDTMRFIESSVYTYVFGLAASMGSFIANSGEAGHRYVLPESTTMIHRLSTGTKEMFGSYYVMELERADENAAWTYSQYLHKRLTTLYQKYNSKGKTYQELENAMKVNNFLTAEKAIEWGLADHIIECKT